MSILGRVLDALKSQIEMRGDIDPMNGSLDIRRVRLTGRTPTCSVTKSV